MPIRRARKARKPQARRPARRPRRQMTNVNKGLQPISSRYICKMKYSEIVTTGLSGRYQMNLNSIHDPNRTGIGHQPYGHDTFQTMYNRYRVINCSYTLYNAVEENAASIQLSVLPSNEASGVLNGSEMRENPRARFVVTNPGAGSPKLKGNVYIPSLMGRTKAQYISDDRYQATFGTDPADLAVLNILTTDNTDLGLSVPVTVVLTYTIECFDPKNLAQS